jgi:hypothetical protein
LAGRGAVVCDAALAAALSWPRYRVVMVRRRLQAKGLYPHAVPREDI